MTVALPYQLKGVRKIEHFNGRALLADDMGLGKSFQSLLWSQNHPEIKPIIILCPAFLKSNWVRECRKHFGIQAQVLNGRTPPKRTQLIQHKIVIINYDILGPWMKYLKRMKAKLLIIDESQNLQSTSSKRSKYTKKLSLSIPHVIALSGTPLLNRPAELFVTLNIIRPDKYGSMAEFGGKYCGRKLTPWGWQYRGARNLDELHEELLVTCMIRRRKIDVLKDLPPKNRIIVPLDIDDRRQYDHASRDLVGWLKTISKKRANRAKKVERLVRMGYLKRLAAELKVKQVREWIENFLTETDEKLIVFGIHKAVLRPLHAHFKQTSTLIDGSVINHKRDIAVAQFLKHRKTRLMFCNIVAAGAGWSAKGVSNILFAELEWRPGLHTQGEDRAWGLNRGKEGVPLSCWYAVASGTIEEALCKVLQDKQKVITHTLDGDDSGDELDIYDLVEQMLINQEKEKRHASRTKKR